ncbi:MAG: transposase [Lentisphaerae bacterium]|nr:transposase [Lentisphaerota bacterium]
MSYDPVIHHRRSIRLKTHNYAGGGVYYVTLATEGRRRLFGTVINGRMVLNDAGRLVRDEWLKSAEIRDEIALDEWVLMPDHFHAIVSIRPRAGDPPVGKKEGDPVAPTGPAPKSLGALIAGFKSAAGKRINQMRQTSGAAVWHRNYYEHIVRDDADLDRIRRYIRDNPANYDVLRFGEPRFMLGNPALLNLPKTAFLSSRRTGDRRVAPLSPDRQVALSPDRRVALSPDRQVALSPDALSPNPQAAFSFPTPPACVISGFLSPMERSVFNDCLAKEAPMVQVLACGLSEAFPTRIQRAIDAGRLLIVTPFPKTIAHVSAARAVWCNQYLLHVADTIVIGHLNPDGMLACLLSELPCDKPIAISSPP